MKKLMIAAVVAAMSFGMAFSAPITTNSVPVITNMIAATDVYTFKMSVKVPYLSNGIRSYSSQTMKGNMYLQYNEFADLKNAYLLVQNTKTKIQHLIRLDVGNFNRLGKATKYTDHSVPVMTALGVDASSNSANQGHEFISEMALAGYGSLKATKIVDCEACGGTGISYCTTINKMSGSVLGVMNCLCEDTDSWSHTVKATRCDDEGPRSRYAPFFGTWTATYNGKTSDPIEFLEKDVPVPYVW